ncbi:Snf11p Ecym_5552 [Eremothecium cymbalariae DBVPG|uniref:Uncharacterized protein n=1 Tax=Eremothecium cymbalariae (strain CBS 270.75 / DBVPG 7215 / KCTC 17166 / NRRL Y-17582) TaxID=931890 RepID=I6NE00_ERECY|nr:hypothetical protein Ecym_5552 [Eremothecium cymbalariae DBVPG\
MDVPLQTSVQYKLQLLLHINTLLILRCTTFKAGSPQVEGLPPDQIDALLRQYVRRIHCNLQCISSMNQGNYSSKPVLMDPPPLSPIMRKQQHQDILPKLYILLGKMFEIW